MASIAGRQIINSIDTGSARELSRRSLDWVKLTLVIAATCVAYSQSLWGGFLWDDDAHVTKPELRSLEGFRRIWLEPFRHDAEGRIQPGATQQYYPLLHSAFWFEYQLWDGSPLGYHIANLFLHGTAVCLCYLVLLRLKIPGAWFAAALFAIHPVQVESVAWITEQKNTLSTVFYFSAMLAYLAFDEQRKWPLYLLAIVFFLLGLLSKTVTATLPAALLVVFWWQRGRLQWRRDFVPLVPFLLLGACAGLFTSWVERKLIGAEGSEFQLSFVDRFLLAGHAMWFYLSKLAWPTNLTFIYPHWNIDARDFWQWLFPFAAILLLIGLWALRARCARRWPQCFCLWARSFRSWAFSTCSPLSIPMWPIIFNIWRASRCLHFSRPR